MTERERWIVYPLLFLALGAALRDKLVDRTTARSIVCQELLIVDEESTGPQTQRTLARIGRTNDKPTATLQINGELLVDVVNAKQYLWQNLAILPMQVAPGLVFPGLQGVPKPVQKVPNPNTPKTQPPGQPPASGSKKSTTPVPPSSPADKDTPPME